MSFVLGFLIWIAVGAVAALLLTRRYPAPGTLPALTVAFGLFGAVIGGMLGIFPYIFHDPAPLRLGGIIGGVLGAVFFPFIYHFMARKAV